MSALGSVRFLIILVQHIQKANSRRFFVVVALCSKGNLASENKCPRCCVYVRSQKCSCLGKMQGWSQTAEQYFLEQDSLNCHLTKSGINICFAALAVQHDHPSVGMSALCLLLLANM